MEILTLLIYCLLLIFISFFAARGRRGNDDFFLAKNSSAWYLVAFGMVSASLSGVSFVSVPGMVRGIGFSYLQTVLGFFFGYVVVAFLLLPLFYKKKLTSIYGYLHERFGRKTRLCGASFFVVSKLVGAAAKLYVAALVVQDFVLSRFEIPFALTLFLTVFLIWFYTFKGGIRSIVFTDCLQTFVLILAIVFIFLELLKFANVNFSSLTQLVLENQNCRIFVFDDWKSSQHFVKQFVSGIFIVIAMTGLDQDMMQKNLSCRTLKQAQKNMLSCGFCFLPINLFLLLIGFLMIFFAQNQGVILPKNPDAIFPFFVSNFLSPIAGILFLLGMLAASVSSADSALTAVTTSIFVDFTLFKNLTNARTRVILHSAICLIFFFIVLIFNYINQKSVIDTIYTVVGYVYGPLLGMFFFGIFSKRKIVDKFAPIVAIFSPIFCFFLSKFAGKFGYFFGYELLIINGFLTFVGFFFLSKIRENGDKISTFHRE